MIGNLFLNRNFKTFGNSFTGGNLEGGLFFPVRLFCKEFSVDDRILLNVSGTGREHGDSLKGLLAGEIENYRTMALVSGKKVFLQLKPAGAGEWAEGAKLMQVSFTYGSGSGSFKGTLSLSENNLRNIFMILGHPIGDLEDFIDETHIAALEKILYRKISGPPPGFSDSLLRVSDRDMQLLLNHILRKNLASPEMLGSYVYSLGDGGKRITDNLSKSVKAEVIEKSKLARLKSTYRWAEEVKYIIHRNIYMAARELDIMIKGMESLEFISRSYEINAAKHLLREKGAAEWLGEFDREGHFKEVLTGIKRRVLTDALSFASWEEVREIFKKYISGDGIELLRQDVEFSRNNPREGRMMSLVRFYRKIKDIAYAPAAAAMDFEKEVTARIPGSDAIDLIVDEIGFAKTVYALKNMPHEWVNAMLAGPLLNIYEDVLSGKIRIKKYDDYRIKESRTEFLKILLILCDEEKI